MCIRDRYKASDTSAPFLVKLALLIDGMPRAIVLVAMMVGPHTPLIAAVSVTSPSAIFETVVWALFGVLMDTNPDGLACQLTVALQGRSGIAYTELPAQMALLPSMKSVGCVTDTVLMLVL